MAASTRLALPPVAPLGRLGLLAFVAGCHLAAIAAISGYGLTRARPLPEPPVIQARLLAPMPTTETAPEASPPQPVRQVRETVASRAQPLQPLTQAASQPQMPPPKRAHKPKAPERRPAPAPTETRPAESLRDEALALAVPDVSPELPPSPPVMPAEAEPSATAMPTVSAELEIPVGIDAAYLSNPAPRYPLASRRLGEQGTVVLRVEVSESGTVSRLDVGSSSGSERLDRAALATVANWRFEPARRGRMAVASAVEVPIIFRLEN